jgi:hypothetical protein
LSPANPRAHRTQHAELYDAGVASVKQVTAAALDLGVSQCLVILFAVIERLARSGQRGDDTTVSL